LYTYTHAQTCIETLDDTFKTDKQKIEDAYKDNRISKEDRDRQIKDLEKKKDADGKALEVLEREMIKIRPIGTTEKIKAKYYYILDSTIKFGSEADVKKGESLYTIAKLRGTTVSKLMKLNHLRKRSKLRIGQILKFN